MKSVVLLILCLSICIGVSSHAVESVPWVEKKAYTAKDGQLFSVRCLTPESPDYIGYSVYPESGYDGEQNKKEFAHGFDGFQWTDNPVRPFIRKRLQSPSRLIEEMKTFPNQDKEPQSKTGRYVVMDSDSACFHIAMNMAMASRFGRPYFFLDRKEDRQPVPWKGPENVVFSMVTATENPEGWIVALGGIPNKTKDDGYEAGAWMIRPATGECTQLDLSEWKISSDDLSGAEWMDNDRLVNIAWSRWSSRLSILNLRTGKTEYETKLGLNGTRGDKLIVGDEIWMLGRDGACSKVYPAPQEDPNAALAVSLEPYDSGDPFGYSFGLRVTLTNKSGYDIALPATWGENAVFQYVWKEADSNEKTEQLMELGCGIQGVDGARVLKSGESLEASSIYGLSDVRIFPPGGDLELSVTVAPVIKKGAPGNGLWTSALVNIGNPNAATQGNYEKALQEGASTIKFLKIPDRGTGSMSITTADEAPITATWTGTTSEGIKEMAFSNQAGEKLWVLKSPAGADWLNLGHGYFVCVDGRADTKSSVMMLALPGKRGGNTSLWNTMLEQAFDFSEVPSRTLAVCNVGGDTFWKTLRAFHDYQKKHGDTSTLMSISEEGGRIFLNVLERASGDKVASEDILESAYHGFRKADPIWIISGTTKKTQNILPQPQL